MRVCIREGRETDRLYPVLRRAHTYTATVLRRMRGGAVLSVGFVQTVNCFG